MHFPVNIMNMLVTGDHLCEHLQLIKTPERRHCFAYCLYNKYRRFQNACDLSALFSLFDQVSKPTAITSPRDNLSGPRPRPKKKKKKKKKP